MVYKIVVTEDAEADLDKSFVIFCLSKRASKPLKMYLKISKIQKKPYRASQAV